MTTLLLSGCAAVQSVRDLVLGAPEPTVTPTAVPREPIPTFTPTQEGQAPTATPVVAEVAQQPTTPPVEEATATTPPEPTATETPAAAPKLVVSSPVNVRGGPGTDYGIIGAANPGDQFDLVGKNQQGDWWQICCINGQQGWIFGQLATVENAEGVEVAQNIPEPPPTALPQPTPVPAPTEAPAAAPPPSSDPCAGIGGDGCKFKVRNGPKFGGNGGQEIKLQLGFIHSGVEGGQAQGSYFVVLEKDGVRLPIGDNVRSVAKDKRSGTLGPYNYEYSLGVNVLPGNTVAGNYTMWVLDGNGERDSQNFSFNVPDGQGLIWIEWDQG
ncbi:MAG: SH3 domain-containing protein [Caldilineaceae bacterium]